jgi:hypothetical protein
MRKRSMSMILTIGLAIESGAESKDIAFIEGCQFANAVAFVCYRKCRVPKDLADAALPVNFEDLDLHGGALTVKGRCITKSRLTRHYGT